MNVRPYSITFAAYIKLHSLIIDALVATSNNDEQLIYLGSDPSALLNHN